MSVVNTVFLAGIWKGKKEIRKNKYLVGLWLVSLAIGWFQTWRNYEEVKVVSILSLLALNGYLAALGTEPKVALSLGRIWMSAWKTIPDFFGEIFGLSKYLKQSAQVKVKGQINWGKIGMATIFAIPMMLVFGGLFYSADPIFANLVNRIHLPVINISGKTVFELVATGICFGVTATLAKFKLADEREGEGMEKDEGLRDGLIWASGVVAGLFAVFTIIQVRYWGVSGDDLRQMGITFSEYTRKGYSEMLLAAGGALGLAYLLNRFKGSRAAAKIGLVLLTLTVIIVLSATKRNYLYQATYGFTRIRLIGYFLSAWMVTALTLAGIKINQTRNDDWFFRKVIALTAVAVLAVNVANIDKMIVSINPPNLGYDTDYYYATNLSADAAEYYPVVIEALEKKLISQNVNWEELMWIRMANRELIEKTESLRRQRENNWQNLARWNGSSAKAVKILESNWEKLGEINRLIAENEKRLGEIDSARRKDGQG